jgi:hypothetical protein
MPSTIIESNGRFTVNNARPPAMRIIVAIAAPIVILLVGVSVVSDVEDRRWAMIAVRAFFALTVILATRFALFGAETIGVEGPELIWRRGKALERRCRLGDVERIEREGNQLRVHIRDDKYPIIVGAGLRQPEAAMEWLSERLQAAITAGQTGR